VFHVKRLFSILLALLMLQALAVPAFADIMWEPANNSFYDKHQDQCEYENRSYYANGKEGFVTLWDAPGGTMVRAQFENGEKLRVYFIYKNNWALAAFWTDGQETSGWVPLSDLELVYDYLCFQEEYADRITPYNGEFADYDGDVETVNFYEYPGAPEISCDFKTGSGDILDNLTGAQGTSCISSIFLDEDGRTWGFVGYVYGIRNSWFCLDEPDGTPDRPDNGNFPIREVAVPELTPAQEPTLPSEGYTPYFLVAVVVAVTAALLAFFYGKKRKKTTD